jgi:hypothetical protein
MFGKQHKIVQWLGKEDLRWPRIVDTRIRIVSIQDYFINTREGLQGVHLIWITLQWNLIFETKGWHMQSMFKITKISNLTFATVKKCDTNIGCSSYLWNFEKMLKMLLKMLKMVDNSLFFNNIFFVWRYSCLSCPPIHNEIFDWFSYNI